MSVLAHWPRRGSELGHQELQQAVRAVESAFASTLETLRVDIGLKEMIEEIYVPLGGWITSIQRHKGGPLVVGINGAQGAGKSTLSNLLEVTLGEGFGLRVVSFSIDDLYKTRTEREALSGHVHPLLLTRGVPGTHDVELGMQILASLMSPEPDRVTKIPVFDKSIDDRCPTSVWQEWVGPADVILFEGWCMGARPQNDIELQCPINALEREEDADGSWRRYVNDQLAGPYAELFAQVDLLLMLQVPSMQAVYEWRSQQETKLAERMRYIHDTQLPADHLKIMNESQIERFIQHYERLTCAMLEEMPVRADVTLRLNQNHKISDILVNRKG